MHGFENTRFDLQRPAVPDRGRGPFAVPVRSLIGFGRELLVDPGSRIGPRGMT